MINYNLIGGYGITEVSTALHLKGTGVSLIFEEAFEED